MPRMIPGSDRAWDPKAGPGGTGGYIPATPQYYPDDPRQTSSNPYSPGGGAGGGGMSTGVGTPLSVSQTKAAGTSGGTAAGSAAAQTAASGGPTNYQVDRYGNTVYQGSTGDPKVLAEQERLKLESMYGSQALAQQTAAQRGLAEQQAGFGTASMNQSAQLQADAERRRLTYLEQLKGGATLPRESFPGAGDVGGGAAQDAIFARAKDKAGQISRASLTGLRNALGERGISGSGIEAMQSAGILGNAEAGLGDVNREQMIQQLQRQAQIQDLTYQGGIQQRGQDLQAMNPQSLIGLITARGLY